ncbi:MAG: hypothetical protein ACOCSP_01865 [archaeon]
MRVATVLSEVFAPELFVLYTTVLVVGLELGQREWNWSGLAGRVGTIVAAWVAAFVVYEGGSAAFATQVPGGDDVFASVGLILGFLLIGAVWQHRGWGRSMRWFAGILVGTSVVHLLIVPFWDLSSHVLYAGVPSGYLAVADRRFAVLLLVPIAVAWSRISLGAHTVPEAIGGLIAALTVIAVVLIVADPSRFER